MISTKKLSNDIDKPNFRSELVSVYQNAEQIIASLKKAEYNSRKVSQELAKNFFNEPNKRNVAAKVWYFMRNEIPYFAEPKSDQTAKTINRLLYDVANKGGTGDCKHYATFAVGLLNACGINAWFTFVGQNKYVKKPNHAYCTCMINGEVIVIDACRDKFNSECKYFYKWDIKRF